MRTGGGCLREPVGGRCCRGLGWSLLGEELESVCGQVAVVVSPGLHCGPGEG